MYRYSTIVFILMLLLSTSNSTSSSANNNISSIYPGTTERISLSSDGAQGNKDSHQASISADGRYVAFDSFASNLVNDDTNLVEDVFVYDRWTGEVTRVSVTTEGAQGNNASHFSSMSADGRYIAFESLASNLVAGDSNNYPDIFVHDQMTRVTSIVSINSYDVQGNDWSVRPSISADGRYIAFYSFSDNLVGGDTNKASDIFLHDQQTGDTSRISLSSEGAQGNNSSVNPTISADNRYIAFFSRASNLVDGDSNAKNDVFVHDRQTGETIRISVASNGTQGNSDSEYPSISGDGRFVGFASFASNLVDGDTNQNWDIFVHDMVTGETKRVSVDSNNIEGNGRSQYPSISTDGRYVAFYSTADNLVEGDTNGSSDVFVHDRLTSETTRISVSSDGMQGNSYSESYLFSLSGDGRFLVFTSTASNLVDGDTNEVEDVFVHDQAGGGIYTISGRVTDESGSPISGVEISTNLGDMTSTGVDGYYLLTEILTGTVQIYPSKAGSVFLPDSLSVHVTHNTTDQDFVAVAATCGGNLSQGESTTDGSACMLPTARPFLYPPVQSLSQPERILQDTDDSGGRIINWFDHKESLYSADNHVELYDGIERNGTPTSTLPGGLSCYERRCFDGNAGLDFSQWDLQHEQLISENAVLPAASGVVMEVCHRDLINYPNEPCDRYSSLGRYIVISHLNNSYATLYAHLASIADWIAPGALIYRFEYYLPSPIGIMGGSGGNLLRENYWPVQLHFQVFFNGNNENPWSPRNDQVVDPFGWLLTGIRPDGWSVPSVSLWKDFSPVSTIPALESTILTIGNVTAEVPAGAVAEGMAVRLAMTSFEHTLDTTLRGIGESFTLQSINLPAVGNSPTGEIDSFSLPITATVNYSGTINAHLDPSEVAIYWFNSNAGTWAKEVTNLDPLTQTAIARVTHEEYFALQASLVCPQDTDEPYDDIPSGKDIVLSYPPDTTISKTFDIQTDVDWFGLEVMAGATYSIRTQNLSPGVDTILTVYQPDGKTVIASDDNSGGGKASWLSMRADVDTVYFIRISQAPESTYGCESAYQVRIVNDLGRIFLPVILAK